MPVLAEIPQCIVCHEPFRKDTGLVRPTRCGHVFCKECSESMKKKAYKCPFHAPTSAAETYEPVYIDFGVHDVAPTESMEVEEKDKLAIGANAIDIHSVELEDIALRLGEIAKSRPENWCTSNDSEYQRGLVFLRACRQLHKIGDGVQGNNTVKDFLHHLADALADLKELYDKMADAIRGNNSVRDKLEQMNDSLRSDRDRTAETLKAKVAWYENRLASERKSHFNEESRLRGDLTTLHTRWKDDQTRRTAAEEKAELLEVELKRMKNNSARYLKKYEREKNRNRTLRQGTGRSSLDGRTESLSDDSLEIESRQSEIEVSHLDEEERADAAPPSSSASLTGNSNGVPETLVPASSKNTSGQRSGTPDPLRSSSLKLNTNPIRKKEKAASAGTLSFASTAADTQDSGWGLKKVPLESKNRTSRPHSSSPTSMSRSKPKFKTKTKEQIRPSGPVIDQELLEILPDLANELESLNHSDMKVADKKKPRSMRSIKVGVPTNPLATLHSAESLREPERKKQRLTMGVIGDWT